jgi:competence protein ComEC
MAGSGWRLAGVALAWLAGVAWQLQQPRLDGASLLAAMLLASVLLLGAAWRWRRAALAGFVALVLLGYASTAWRADQRLAERLEPALEGVDLLVTGIVAGLPQQGITGARFRFEVESAHRDGAPVQVPRLLSLGWYLALHEDAIAEAPQRALQAGQRWQFVVRLRQPHGNANPHGLDVELLLFEQGVRATGSVRDAPALLQDRAAGYPVQRLRQWVRDAIEARVREPRAAGVLAALAVGDQGAIEREDWELFRNTGVAHLMSISGLHVTMFAWLAGAAIGALWRRSPRATLALPAPTAARWGGLVAALAYAVFSGFGVPAQRTVLMLAAVVLLPALGARWPWPLLLLWAALLVALWDPWALLRAGFWLSFAAVSLLMASEPAQRQAPAGADGAAAGLLRRLLRAAAVQLGGGLRTQVVATLGLAPLTLVFFQQLSLVGFAANLLAIPLVTLVITPLALGGVLLPGLWSAGAWVVEQFVTLLGAMAALPWAVWVAGAAPAWAQAAALLGAALLVMPLPWRLRALALPLALPLLWPQPAVPPEGQFELLAADVGQGTAVLVRTRSHLLVYDAGPQYSVLNDAGTRVLLPLLHARGERRIDELLLSHRDADHVGGAAALLRGLPVGRLRSSLEEGHALLAMGVPHVRCRAGQAWSWDGVEFAVLHPLEADEARTLRPNARSCVLRVRAAGGGSALLTGDIEAEQELALVARAAATPGATLRSQVLVAPHHGSRTSSTAELLAAVQPEVAVFQAGYRNRFGHPAADVLARYRAAGVVLRDSPSCGAWAWSSTTAGTARPGVCQRDAGRRYWHHQAAPSP